MKTYKDVISGSTRYSRRPGMSEMFEDIENGFIDAVVVQALDRLCRDLDATGEINCFLKDHNITLYQCRSDVDDTTMRGKTHLNVQRFIGQMELDHIKERTRLGRESKMKRVGWVGGRVPFGYMKPDSTKDSIPIINENEASTIREIYDLYWDKNMKISLIVKHLNSNGFKPGRYAKSGVWRNSSVIRILKDHYDKYSGSLINNNVNNIRWDKVLDKSYEKYPNPKV